MSSSTVSIHRLFDCPMLLARVLEALVRNRITGQSAKRVFLLGLQDNTRGVDSIIRDERLELEKLPEAEYRRMAQNLVDSNQDMAAKVRNGQSGKMMWFVGQMMREGKGSIEADKAKAVLEELLTDKPS